MHPRPASRAGNDDQRQVRGGGALDGAGQLSPTTEAMLPIMNAESVTPKATRRARIIPVPTSAASFSPVRCCSSLSFW